MTEIRIDELIAQLLELETLLKTKLKMEDQKTPLMGAVAEPQADEVVITPEGPIKPLLPQEFDASLPEPEITDNSTADGLSADQKLEGFKQAFFGHLNKQPVGFLVTLNNSTRTAVNLLDQLNEGRLDAMKGAESEEMREYIHYNFNIDVLIEHAYACVDALETLRKETEAGQSMQPIHDTAINLAAVGLALATGLISGMEIRDNPNRRQEQEPATDGFEQAMSQVRAEQTVRDAGGRIEEGYIQFDFPLDPEATDLIEATRYLVQECGYRLKTHS